MRLAVTQSVIALLYYMQTTIVSGYGPLNTLIIYWVYNISVNTDYIVYFVAS